jgi:hypothetical protein
LVLDIRPVGAGRIILLISSQPLLRASQTAQNSRRTYVTAPTVVKAEGNVRSTELLTVLIPRRKLQK